MRWRRKKEPTDEEVATEVAIRDLKTAHDKAKMATKASRDFLAEFLKAQSQEKANGDG